jgi:hypothetical protein
MFQIVEPLWGIELLWQLHEWMLASESLVYWIPKLADIFIFTYPVYFLVLYFGDFWRKKIKYKLAALFVAGSAVFAVVVNLLIQVFLGKVRPHIVL